MAVEKENRDNSLLEQAKQPLISEDPELALDPTSLLELEESEDKITQESDEPGNPWWKVVRGWPPIHFRLTLEGSLYALIILLAIFTRLWDLDVRALHHDEGVHAYYSWRYYDGGGYAQEPWKHGPFLYHITALTFWLFGPSDFTARLPTALFGVLICLLPLALRRELGRWGALTASFLLAVSPTFLYFSRFLREDIFMAFATLLLFIGLVRFVRQPSARWWYIALSALGLLYCTKEASYFYTALFFGFIFLWMCWQIAPRLVFIFAGYLGVALFTFSFVAGFYPPPPIPFEQINNLLLTKYLSALVVHPVFWTVIILAVLGLIVAWFAFKEVASARREFLVATGRADPDISATESLFLPYEMGSPAYAVGWLGRHWKVTGFGLFILFTIYSVLYTGFFSSTAQGEVGLISGLWYWMAQQGVARGAQPWYYYFFLLPLYEPLALLFGTLGGGLAIFQFVRHSFRRPVRRVQVPVEPETSISLKKPSFDDELDELDPVPGHSPALKEPLPAKKAPELKWVKVALPQHQPGNSLWPGKIRRGEHPYFVPLLLAVWAFGSLGFYTWASEKMPWLTVQVALPFILLAAYFFQPVWQGIEQYLFSRASRKLVLWNMSGRFIFWLLVISITFTFCLAFMIGLYLTASAIRLNVGGTQYNWIIIWIPVLLALTVFGAAGLILWSRVALYATLAVAFVMFSIFLVRTGFGYAFYQGDIPVEMGIYTQTAPDVKRTVKQLQNLTLMLPEQKATPILYDDEMRTPLDFYLREYPNVRKSRDFTPAGLQTSLVNNLTDYPIIMITDDKRNAMDDTQKKVLETRYISRHLVFRWWFAEEPYRNFEQSDQKEIDFLRDKVSKVTVKDAEGNVAVRQGEIMSEIKLTSARDARGNVLDKLYNGNGGNTLLLNLSESVKAGVNLANPADFSRLWRFVFYREQVQPVGHLDYTLYIRNDLAGLYRQYGDLVPYPISQP